MKIIKNKNFKEICRDFFSLGSWVFYALVVFRALIKPYRPFSDEVIIAAVVLLLINIFIKEYDGYTARGLILVVFTIIFYQNKTFSIFAVLVFIGLIVSSYIVGNSRSRIIKGLIIGIICAVVSYYLSGFSLKL